MEHNETLTCARADGRFLFVVFVRYGLSRDMLGSNGEFAHGSYGDDSGAIFYAGPPDDPMTERLIISDRFVDALFRAVLDRAVRIGAAGGMPRLVDEWNRLEGWNDGFEAVEVPQADARDLLTALSAVSLADLAPYSWGTTPADCLRCAAAIAAFVEPVLARGECVYLQND
jgi:hypothetical protein